MKSSVIVAMASAETTLDDEPENDFDDEETSSGRDSRSFYSDDQSYRSGKGGDHSHASPPLVDGDGSHRSRGSDSQRSYRSGDDSRGGGDSYDERSYRSEGSYRSGDGSQRNGSSRSFAEDEESFRSRGSHSQTSYRSGDGSYESGSTRSFAEEESSLHSQGSFQSSQVEESHGSAISRSFAGEGNRQSDGAGSLDGARSDRSPGSDRSRNSDSINVRSERSQKNEPYENHGSSFGSDTDGEQSFIGDSPRQFADSQHSDDASSESGTDAPSFAEDSVFSPIESPRKPASTSSALFENCAFGSETFASQRTDDEKANSDLSENGFSNNSHFEQHAAGAAFNDFNEGRFAPTETDRDFDRDVFGSTATNGFGSFGSGPEGSVDLFAPEAFGENIFAAEVLATSTSDSRSTRDDGRAAQINPISSRSLQPETDPNDCTVPFINGSRASQLPEASIKGKNNSISSARSEITNLMSILRTETTRTSHRISESGRSAQVCMLWRLIVYRNLLTTRATSQEKRPL